MINLSREEIIAQLKRFGINNGFELNFYLKDYKKYCELLETYGAGNSERERIFAGHTIEKYLVSA